MPLGRTFPQGVRFGFFTLSVFIRLCRFDEGEFIEEILGAYCVIRDVFEYFHYVRPLRVVFMGASTC